MVNISEQLKRKLSKIKLFATDVDGVLTDGGLFYSEEGLALKKFHVKDGMAVKLLRDYGIETAIITSDYMQMPIKRAERLRIKYCYIGTWEKLEKLKEICDELNITLNECAYIGDDINDLEVIQKVGVSFAPSDAVNTIKKNVDIICETPGGRGAFREAAEYIIAAQSIS